MEANRAATEARAVREPAKKRPSSMETNPAGKNRPSAQRNSLPERRWAWERQVAKAVGLSPVQNMPSSKREIRTK
jgi:hypothetical protein